MACASFSYSASCDSLTISITSDPTAYTCDTFHVRALVHSTANTSTISNVGVAINFQKDTSTFTTSPVHNSTSGNFLIYTLGSITAGSYDTLDLIVIYNCSSIGSSLALLQTTQIRDTFEVSIGGLICDPPYPVHTYNLTSPALVANAQGSVAVLGGSTASRTFTLTNTASGSHFRNYFSFKDSLDGPAKSFMRILGADVYKNNSLLTSFSATDTARIIFSISSIASAINQNDQLKVIENFEIFGCPAAGGKTFLYYGWGCKASEVCADSTIDSLAITRLFPTANVMIKRILPSPDITKQYWDSSCVGDTTHWRFQIVNNGSIYFDAHILLDHQNGNDFPYYTYVLNDASHPVTCTPAITATITNMIDTLFQTGPQPHCMQQNPDAIYMADFFVDTIFPNDTFYIDFFTLRCCPDDESIDSSATPEYDLFSGNGHVYFNHWLLRVKANSNCDSMLTTISVKDGPGSLYRGSAISSQFGNNNAEADLIFQQDYFPTVADLTVPHNQICGVSQVFSIRNTKFAEYNVYSKYDAQLYQNDTASSPHGNIKVRIEVLPGLNFDTTAVNRPYMQSSTYRWNADSAFREMIPSPAAAGIRCWESTFTFSNANFPTFQSFQDFLNFSQFYFYLFPCCTDHSASGFVTKFYFNPLARNSCDNCYIPLSSINDSLQIRCPGCKTFGIETVGLSLLRDTSSYGLYDRDNDGLADNSLTKVAPNDTITRFMRLNASIAGDHLVATISGVFHDGSLTPKHNLTYSRYRNTHTPPKYLYAELEIASGDQSFFDLVADSAELTIFSDSCNCTFIYPIDTAAEMDRSGSMYFFKFLTSNFDTAYHMKPNDSLVITIHYTVCKNYVHGGEDAEFNRYDADPVAAMYFTDTTLSAAALLTQTSGIINADSGYSALCYPVVVDSCTYNAESLDPDWLYFCGAYDCIHRFYSVRIRDASKREDQISGNVCQKQILFHTLWMIGGNTANVFPYEFRPALPLNEIPVPQFQAQIPTGFKCFGTRPELSFYAYKGGCADRNLYRVYTIDTLPGLTGTQSFAYPNIAYATENIPLNLVQICDTTYFQAGINPPLFEGDEFFDQKYTVYLSADCSVQACTTALNDSVDISWLQTYGCSADTFRTTLDTSHFSMPYIDASDSINCVLNAQLLRMNPVGPVSVSSRTASFNIQLINNSPVANPCIAAPNTWIYVPADSFLQALQIICTTNNSQCPLYNTPYHPTDANGFFELGNMPCGIQCDYILKADYAICQAPGGYDLPIWYGWNCGEYPTNPNIYPDSLGHACAQYLPRTLHVNQADLSFIQFDDSSFQQPDTFALCQPYQFQACVESQYGGIFGITAIINLHDTALALNDTSVYLTIENDTSILVSVTQVSDSVYTVDLSPYDYLWDGSATVNQLDSGDWICLQFTVTPTCGYTNDAMPEVMFGGISFCGDTIPDTVQVSLSHWIANGDSCPCTPLFLVDAGRDQLTCDSNCVSLEATITGNPNNLTYLWNPGALTGATPTVCPDTSTSFIVTVTDTISNATQTDSVRVSVISTTLGCCIPDNFQAGQDYNFSDTFASQLPFTSVNTSNIILINDTFTVDTNFGFYTCPNIVMGPNAFINVLPGVTLTISDGCHFYSCDSMWNEIFIPDASARVIINSSIMEDAYKAVHSESGGRFDIDGSIFNRNMKAIVANNYNDTLQATVIGCTFTCEDAGGNLTFMNNGEYSYSGISIDTVLLVKIGDSLASKNYFRHLYYGIKAEASLLIAQNLKFNDMTRYGTHYTVDDNIPLWYMSKYDGYGIYSHLPQYYTARNLEVQKCDFHYVGWGIAAMNSISSTISLNSFDSLRQGAVYISNPTGRNIYITNNTVTHFFNGIYMREPRLAQTTKIQFNTFDVPSDINPASALYQAKFWGIKMINKFPAPTQANISGNRMLNQRKGVYCLNTQSIAVDLNYISLIGQSYSGSQYGVWLINSDNARLQKDSIIMPAGDTSTTHVRGIRFEASKNCTIKENYILNTGTGINGLNPCNLTLLTCNKMKNCMRGMMYENISLPQQGDVGQPQDNKWLNIALANRCVGTGSQIAWFHRYLQSDTGQFSPGFSNLVNSFQNQTGQSPCNNPADTLDTAIVFVDHVLHEIIIDSLVYPLYDEENDYMGKEYAYRLLSTDSTLMDRGLPSDATYQQFYDDMKQRNLGKLIDIDELIGSDDYANALTELFSIQDSNLIERNKIKAYSYIIPLLEDENYVLNSLDSTILDSVSIQLAILGGEGVYIIRAIMDEEIDDNITGLLFRKANNNIISNQIESKVYPNPNKGSFTYEYILNDSCCYEITITDARGRLIKLSQLRNEKGSVEINSIQNNGIYFLILRREGEIVDWKKIIVVN